MKKVILEERDGILTLLHLQVLKDQPALQELQFVLFC